MEKKTNYGVGSSYLRHIRESRYIYVSVTFGGVRLLGSLLNMREIKAHLSVVACTQIFIALVIC
jgi:hypothetical protein